MIDRLRFDLYELKAMNNDLDFTKKWIPTDMGHWIIGKIEFAIRGLKIVKDIEPTYYRSMPLKLREAKRMIRDVYFMLQVSSILPN